MRLDPPKPWFAPKRYGYGSSWPIAWQGWAVLAAYFLANIGGMLIAQEIFPNGIFIAAIIGVALFSTIILIIICAAKTKAVGTGAGAGSHRTGTNP
mgnify:CR=1 FL=1